jgi:hypothetical protein
MESGTAQSVDSYDCDFKKTEVVIERTLSGVLEFLYRLGGRQKECLENVKLQRAFKDLESV